MGRNAENFEIDHAFKLRNESFKWAGIGRKMSCKCGRNWLKMREKWAGNGGEMGR